MFIEITLKYPTSNGISKDVQKFEFRISQAGIYDLYFTMRYVTGYPNPNILVKISQKTPEGKEYFKDCVFRIIDQNQNYIGEVAGNMWDFEECFAEKQDLESGIYQFEIEQTMPEDPVILIVDVGLIVRKSEE
jgi:gliding motility-associated lipoprotein GldH